RYDYHPAIPPCPTRRSSDLIQIKRDLTYIGQAQLVSLFAHAAMAENMRLMPAIGADKHRHILDQAQNRGLELVKHVNRAPCVDQDRKSTRLNSSHVSISYAV